MGYLVLGIITIFFIYFIYKKIKERRLNRDTAEIFGEIKLRHQKKQQIIIQTKLGNLTLNVKPEEFMSLGVGLVGIFRYNEKDYSLVHFTPYQKV